MTVSELIEFLKTQPQDIQVAYKEAETDFSNDRAWVLDEQDIKVVRFSQTWCPGGLQIFRDDTPTQQYLVFPGN